MNDGWTGSDPYPEERQPSRPRVNPHRRLRSETVALTLDHAGAEHLLDVSLAYDEGGILRELVFVGRGKIGQGLDLLLHDLGIKLSRAIQGRDPDTGASPPRGSAHDHSEVPGEHRRRERARRDVADDFVTFGEFHWRLD